jgi:hypothetical protein
LDQLWFYLAQPVFAKPGNYCPKHRNKFFFFIGKMKEYIMKNLILFSLLSALSFSTVAQSTMDVETVTISKPELKIEIPSKLYGMPSSEFYDYKRVYTLSNGETLSLFEVGMSKYAQVSGQERHKIVATAKNAFVALDKQLQMRIDLKDDDASGELLMVVPAQKMSQNGTGATQLILAVLR